MTRLSATRPKTRLEKMGSQALVASLFVFGHGAPTSQAAVVPTNINKVVVVIEENHSYGGLQSQSQPAGGVFSKKTSLGVRKPRHARGRSLSSISTARTAL